MEKSRPLFAMKSNMKGVGIGLGILLGALVLVAGVAITIPTEPSYRFVKADHPTEMWSDGGDNWSYYFIGEGTATKVASTVRKELSARGFTEDRTHKPWFVFVKGSQEVVVCNHHDFMVINTGSRAKVALDPDWKTSVTPPAPVILVKNGPGTSTPWMSFKAKKTLFGW